jgi:hypothetical protein
MATTSLTADERITHCAKLAKGFIDSARRIADDLIDRGDNVFGLMGFSYGVIDAMGQRAGLDESDTEKLLDRYLIDTLVGDVARVEAVKTVMADVAASEDWSHAVLVGGQAAMEFIYDGRFSANYALRKMLEMKGEIR